MISHYKKLAAHFQLVKDYSMAEKFYVDAGMYKEAIQMYNTAGQTIHY